MSVPDTAVAARRKTALLVRGAVPADHPAIRAVVVAAYGQYADLLPPDIFSAYLADLLDVETHASNGPLFVAEADERVCGYAAFYPDASVQGVGWPPGWASGRALAVDPAGRGHGVARALIATGERLGYRRAPEFDFDVAARFGRPGAARITALAYLRCLTPARAHGSGLRHARCPAGSIQPKQRNHQ